MELRQLRYFLQVVELGSMGKAAQKLDVGTSALSQQISRLEGGHTKAARGRKEGRKQEKRSGNRNPLWVSDFL